MQRGRIASMSEDQIIRDVLLGAQKYMLKQLPKEEWNYEFSPRFQKRMKKLFKKCKHPIQYFLLKSVAVFLGVVLLGGLILGFNEDARAQVMTWIREHISNNEYRYINKNVHNEEDKDYSLEGVIPREYSLRMSNHENDRIMEIYEDESGNLLYLMVMKSGYTNEYHVLSDEDKPNDSVYIGNYYAELYISDRSDEPSVIVWQDEDGSLISIQGVVEKELLIQLAEMAGRE